MVTMNKFLATLAAIGIAALLALPGAATAQEATAEHLAVARKAVDATQSTASMDAILPNLGESAKQQLIANRPDAADQISTLVDEVTISLAGRRGDLEGEVARIYARIFTESELNEIIAFYETDAGKKLIRQTPIIARAMDNATRVWTSGVQRDLQAAVAKKIQEAGL